MFAQFDEGPISPKPGPILPIAEADTDNAVLKFKPKHAKTMAEKTKIKI